MYIYLSKKIAIPNNTKINCIAWNKEDGYIAVGGEGGLLKVLKLDSGNENDSGSKTKGLTAASNLSMNQTLEGHTESIRVITWNQKHEKLTTSDQNGIIIVWMLYKGTWYEEMINNRKKSVVVGMSWNFDGSKICIIYEDGAVIVGSVDGNRIWGKELKSVPLSKVQWSPDGKLLLFGLKNGLVHLYDNLGNFVMPIEILCIKMFSIAMDNSIVSMDWYNGKYGHIYALCPTLAICYENGFMQLMCSESDPEPIIVETRMNATVCCWNHNGSLLAVAGKQNQHDDNKSSNIVQFYNPFGEHLRTLKLPGQAVSSCSWEEGSLRIALGIDSSVYFANIRPDYKWCYFKNTIVYTSCRLQKAGVCVSFWDVVNHQCHVRYVPVLLALAAYGEHCVLATRVDTDNPMGQYGLLLCNTLGTPVDGKYTDIEVKWVAMNNTHVIAASKSNYFLWQYRTPKSAVVNLSDAKCQIHHVDYDPTGASLVMKDFKLPVDMPQGSHESYNPICCITASDKYLIIGKESGTLKQFSIPLIEIVNTYTLPVRPHKMSINCNSTRLSVIDMAGVLTVLDITETALKSNESENTRLERRDVWAMCWASDNPQFLAIMEKTRMYIFKGIYPEEPISSAGYICSFQNLEIQAVLLDEVMETPEKPSKEHLFKLEIKSLRDTRQLLEKVGINEAAQFIEDNPHARLWQLLGEAAFKDLNLKIAEEAFIRSLNYSGIQLVKKLQGMSNDAVRKALVAAYFKNFDEAEKLYTEADRSDMALNMRKTLGDWFRVLQILKNGVAAPDELVETALNRTADYFTHTNNWSAAIEYYELSENKKKMIESYFHLQDYKSLEKIMEQLDHNDPLLKYIAKIFTAEGDYTSAIKAYLKMGDLDGAINISVVYHHWEQAINIAKKNHVDQVPKLFKNYTEHLVKENKLYKAVEVNVKAKYWFAAAKCAAKLAEQEARKSNKEPIKIKRMYVYSARLIELHKKDPNIEETVEGLTDSGFLENAWKGAEAFHFYSLAHQQLYNRQIHDAVCTLYNLLSYTSYLPPEEVCAILALAAYLDGAFDLCSKMFVKLGLLPKLSVEEKAEYDKLALKIFSSQEPTDLEQRKKYSNCFNCHSKLFDWEASCPHCDIEFAICIASGRSLIAQDLPQKVCPTCHHVAIESSLGFKRNCPLCHNYLI